MAIRKEILDELLKDYQKPEDLLGQSGLLQQLSKALIERGLDGEMTHHLGYEKHPPEGKNSVFLRQMESAHFYGGATPFCRRNTVNANQHSVSYLSTATSFNVHARSRHTPNGCG
jgi:hypothetical protein